jgi:hypothetical protein
MGNGIGIIISIFLLILIFIIFLIGQDIINFRIGEPDLRASLGERFTVGENQFTVIQEEDLKIEVKEFIYSPCEEGMYCVWSGLRVTLEFTKGGEKISKDFELKDDFRFVFDYKVTMIDTDYETYVDLKVERVD